MNKAKIHLKGAYHDFLCGRHSNFPICCNLCYSVGDNISHLHRHRYYRYRRYMNHIVSRLRNKDFGYIPCPICVALRDPNKVKRCNCHKDKNIMGNRAKIQNKERLSQNSTISRNHVKIDKIMDIVFEGRKLGKPWFRR